MTKINNWLNSDTLIGNPKSFTLEERIFNTFSVIAFIAMGVEIPFNFSIGLHGPGWICVFGFIFSAFLYYISRVKRQSRLGVYLFSIVCNAAFTINYFYNSGIYGPNLLLFIIAFLIIIAIIPKEHFIIWVPLNMLVVFAILLYEYYYPISSAYQNGASKTIDFGVTYLVTVLITYFAIAYIRKNYDAERNAVVQKNVEIEAQNKRISDQKLELEKINSEKNKLFSIVSHDIRAPLSSIQGYLEILSEVDLSDKEKTEMKERLLQVTKDTSDMITNVLVWSKSQLEGARTNFIRINLGNFIQQNLNLEKDIAQKKGLKLSIETEKDLDVMADENMLQIVLRNLVNNAIKFTPRGGLINVLAYGENGHCLFKVVDNGLGISDASKKELFQLKATSTYGTNNEKGIGLGLVLCKEFTEIQGGEIWYEDKDSEGTTFAISFPKAK